MNQSVLSLLKNKPILSMRPSQNKQHLKKQLKSKQRINHMASKSFSQSFLKQYSSRKSINYQHQTKSRFNQNTSKSQHVHHKKHSQIKNSNQENRLQKKKGLLIKALDKNQLKKSLNIKTKSQNHKLNLSSQSNNRYGSLQRKKQLKSNHNQKIESYSYKNKSEANILQSHKREEQKQKQKQLIKSISSTVKSTVKNNEYKNRVLNHLENKNRKKNSNLLSISQRKKISQKLQQKLSNLISISDQQYKGLIQKQDKQTKSQSQRKQKKLVEQTSNNQIPSKYQNNQTENPHNNKQIEQTEKLEFKFAFRTRKGKNINNPKKVNQDSILVKQNISKKDLHMIAVADGHGSNGHYVSQFVIKNLSKHFSQHINETLQIQASKNHHSQKNYLTQITVFLPVIYDKIQTDLSCSQINSVTSGCTLVNVIFQKDQIICANVGDSRAILARQNLQVDKKNWELIYLSEDHKPQNQNQRKRILKHGGRIHSFKGQNGQNLGPLRVWLPNQNIQGLAMTRSFGDNVSKSVGVTHKPQMIKVRINEKDKFILVASDGVWQFISNQQILQLIAPYYKQRKLEQASDALLKLAYERWTQDDDSVVDDISFVLVFLNT